MYEDVYAALDAGGEQIGYVVNVTTKEGFGGEITVSLGLDMDGGITGMEFLTINETAGLGMRATEEAFRSQYVGEPAGEFELVKDTAGEGQIQAISGATITSTAVTNAVNAALYLVDSVNG